MRELHLSDEESTETFFVLYDQDGVRYQLARAELAAPESEEAGAKESLGVGLGPDLADGAPATAGEAGEAKAGDASPGDGGSTRVGADSPSSPDAVARAAHAPGTPDAAAAPAAEPRSLPEPDPLYATALSMRPNEIQTRIRSGATAAELAEEMGVAESRVEPYAHPVLLERAQVAEAAKLSHPLREDGPAKLTLFEILASAFAARGHSLHDATWDATRDPGDSWVVHLRWSTGLSENEALWAFHRQMGSNATTEARNGAAADLTDPNFVQPVRSLTAVDTRPAGYDRTGAEGFDEPAGETVTERGGSNSEHTESTESAESSTGGAAGDSAGDAQVVEGDFLRHPGEEEQPTQRRRKAVTPHWEDVLLGVRTNQKRPRN